MLSTRSCFSTTGRCSRASSPYASTIESLEKRLSREKYQWRLLRPDAPADEQAGYKRLDNAVLEYF